MVSWEVMKIKGIPLRIHPSWLLVFLYFTLSAKDQFETLLDGQASIWNGWVIGAITSFSLIIPNIVPIISFPDPGGPYATGSLIHHWVDESRDEWFTPENSDDKRQFMLQIWYHFCHQKKKNRQKIYL